MKRIIPIILLFSTTLVHAQRATEQPVIDMSKPVSEQYGQTGGFHIQQAAKWQMATPILCLGGVGFAIGGALELTSNNMLNRALVSTGCVLVSAAITSQIISAVHLKKAGKKFEFIELRAPLKK